MTLTQTARLQALPRSYFACFQPITITTAWMDNDACGHINNIVHHNFFDAAVPLLPARCLGAGLQRRLACAALRPHQRALPTSTPTTAA